MHPPGKRSIDINICQNRIDTRGRTQRSAPTRRFIIRPSTIKHLHLTTRRRVECGAGVPGAGHFSRRGSASKWTFGVCQGGYRPRWSKATDRQEIIRRDHRGWSTHRTASHDRPAKPNRAPNGIFVTSGEIGTNAMHPPGKFIIDINKQQNRIDTRGRTRRSAPTRKICNTAIHNQTFKPNDATAGGMWSGCAVSRSF